MKLLSLLVVLLPLCWSYGTPVPDAPPWLKQLPTTPPWWSGVPTSDANGSLSNSWKSMAASESIINELVANGRPAVEERRSLIKFLFALKESAVLSAADKESVQSRIADLYSRLGDHKMAARTLFELCNTYGPKWEFIYSLGNEYETLGDKENAIAIYKFMKEEFKNERLPVSFAAREISCLNGETHACDLTRPPWWERYKDAPTWWNDIDIRLPSFSCYRDGTDFIAHTIAKSGDKKKIVKANVALSNYTPVTSRQKISSVMSIATTYAAMGDHHRAIESAWRIQEQFSCDFMECKKALEFIAVEFDKLGEKENAEKVRRALSVYMETIGK